MRTLILCSILSIIPAVCRAADDPRVDTATGRDLANYPPPRYFDHIHMRLAIDIPDMTERKLTGIETLTVTPIGTARSELVLNARDLKVDSIELAGRAGAAGKPLAYTHDKGLLTIKFNPPVKLGETVDVITRYSLEANRGGGTGLTWTRGRETAKGETDKAAQIHSQGQPEHNRKWFPCHDFPNERLTTELFVTVEDPYVVASNGRLIGTALGSPSAKGKPRMTWHWLQDKPHANYLVSMIVGRLSIVGLTATTPEEDAVRCWLYTPVGTEKSAAAAYADTPAMVAHFSKLFGQPYPWDKYTQALVRNFQAGGMENTSATTMQAGSAEAPPGSQNEVISHELAHQWFGDLMTNKSWEHAWLNEGWASFAEALWEEKAAAPGKERREYQRMITGFVRAQTALNRTYAPTFPPLVSNRYNDPMQNFMKPNDIYAKGACVLHMLRMQLGDEVFWRGVHAYIQKHKFTCVETDDFRYCLEEASGLSLERFFSQWCYRPGLPRLNVEIEWTPEDSGKPEGAGSLMVSLAQTQRINTDNPAFALRLPVAIKLGEKTDVRVVEMDVRSAALMVKLPTKPTDVTVDPDLTVVAPVSVKKPLAMWLEQARDESSLFAQLQAIEHLSLMEEPEARRAISDAAGSGDRTLREAAGEALKRERVVTAKEVSR